MAIGPLVLIQRRYKGDAGLLAHELEHARQFLPWQAHIQLDETLDISAVQYVTVAAEVGDQLSVGCRGLERDARVAAADAFDDAFAAYVERFLDAS